jgi:N-methylhydantoinase A
MLFSDLRYDAVRTWYRRLAEVSFDDFDAVYGELFAQARRALDASGVKASRISLTRAADMRYVGQEHPVTVDLPEALFRKRDRAGIKKHFDEVHLQRYGTCAPEEQAELVSPGPSASRAGRVIRRRPRAADRAASSSARPARP